VSYYNRLYKFVTPVTFSTSVSSGDAVVQPRAVRLRRGRGGRMLVDRRHAVARSIVASSRSSLFDLNSRDEDDMEVDGRTDAERVNRLMERWRFDMDDFPAVGPHGADEQDRILVDDFEPKSGFRFFAKMF
jgi:enhancer of polycomb-like protein